MASKDSFYVSIAGLEEGPYTAADIRSLAISGRVKATTQVRRGDSAKVWFKASEVPGAFSDKEWLIALLISFFLGALGIDRFYLGYTGLGILKLVTFGGLGLWALIDFILIAVDNMRDSNGLALRR